jgi:hypothetical protein
LRWPVDNDLVKQVGIHESPTESNCGPKIDEWEGLFGLKGQPWCGCFAGDAVEKIGGANCGRGKSSATRDSDGGIVETRERSFAEVTCVARIEDWS